MATDTLPAPPRPPLGVTDIFESSFRIFLANALPLFLVAFVPTVLVTIVTDRMTIAMMQQALAVTGDPVTDPVTSFFTLFSGTFLAIMLISTLIGGLVIGLLTLIAADIIAGKGLRLGAALATTLARIVPLVVLLVIASLGFMLGWMLLFIPGLILMAMWSVMLPALLIENRGLAALGRSRALTKGYRWPIIGGYGLLILVLIGLSIPLSFLPAGVDFETGFTITPIPLWSSILTAIPSALFYGAWSIFTVLLYNRLVEIKEGGPDGLAHIFD